MNVVLEVRLQLVLSGNRQKKRNRQKNSLGLIEQWRKNLFYKACLNILKAKNAR